MKILKSIEQRLSLVTTCIVSTIIFAVLVLLLCLVFVMLVKKKANNQIFVLSDNTPVYAIRTDFDVNRPVEYKATINDFHTLFFNTTPDIKIIESNIGKAMYLIDESGLSQYRNIKAKGYFSQIINSSTVINLMTDSVKLDVSSKSFTFYGRLIIDRKSARLVRSLVTTGKVVDIPRSENNSHGVLLTDWKTIENKDLDSTEKYVN